MPPATDSTILSIYTCPTVQLKVSQALEVSEDEESRHHCLFDHHRCGDHCDPHLEILPKIKHRNRGARGRGDQGECTREPIRRVQPVEGRIRQLRHPRPASTCCPLHPQKEEDEEQHSAPCNRHGPSSPSPPPETSQWPSSPPPPPPSILPT